METFLELFVCLCSQLTPWEPDEGGEQPRQGMGMLQRVLRRCKPPWGIGPSLVTVPLEPFLWKMPF